MTCDQLHEASAELALGTAEARQRADALVHLEHCADCRAELRGLRDIADGLAAVLPAAEPPAGFESRVLEALAAARPAPAEDLEPSPTDSLAAPHAARAGAGARSPYRRVVQVAAGVAVVAAAGFAGWGVGADRSRPAAASVDTAPLLSSGHSVGQVVLTAAPHPWMSVAVDDPVGTNWVRCELREQNGDVVTVGSFSLSTGYGYWAAPIPGGTGTVTGAQLVDPAGHVVATAAIR